MQVYFPLKYITEFIKYIYDLTGALYVSSQSFIIQCRHEPNLCVREQSEKNLIEDSKGSFLAFNAKINSYKAL